VAEWLAREAESRDRIWLVASEGASPVTAAIVWSQLEALADAGRSATVASAEIVEFVPKASAARPAPAAYRALFGGKLTLVDAHLDEAASWPGSARATLRWQAATGSRPDYRAVVALRDQRGDTWKAVEELVRNEVAFPTSAWEPQAWTDTTYQLELPPGIPPGEFWLEVGLYDRATGARVGGAGPDGSFLGTRVRVGLVRVERPQVSPDVADLDPSLWLDMSVGPLTLLGANPPVAEAASGDQVSFSLFWEAEARPGTDYGLRIEWIDSEGEVRFESVEPLSLYPTSRWQPGDRFRTQHRLHVTPDLPPGSFQLALRVVDAVTGSSVADAISLTEVEIRPRNRSFSFPDEDLHPLQLMFGEHIHLRGYKVDETDVASGDTVPLSLYWQADEEAGAPDRDVSLFVHLLGPDGVPHGQVDRVPGGGAWPTSSWAPSQVIVDRIELPVVQGAPAGEYVIAVGFYDPRYGGRLQVTSPGEAEGPVTQAVLPVHVTVSEELK